MAARKLNLGDSVDLGEHGKGQVFASAPGNMNWHVVDENQTAHLYNERSGTSTPARCAEFEMANYRRNITDKYAPHANWHTQDVGRRGYLNDTEGAALAKVKSPNAAKAKRVRKAG